MSRRFLGLAAALILALACARGRAAPARLDTENDLCAFCRMPVSDPRLAAQIAAPGEEPKFFDDIGCLRDFLARQDALPGGAALYVADHRTGAWVPAEQAVFTRSPSVETPMGSHLLAHADAASRDADPAARGGTPLRFEDTLQVSGRRKFPGSAAPAREAGEVRR